MIDRLSERTRERLRSETPAELEASKVKVAELTTASFEAYQHYFRGDQLKEAIRYEQAIEEYRKAIALDPTFALPHYRIAYLGQFTGLEEDARRAEMEAGLRNLDRVPAKERLLMQAWKAHMDGRNGEAHGLYSQAAEAYPQDKEALFMAGDLYLHEDKGAEALPFFERAVALDPTWEPALMHLTDCLGMLGRTEELAQRTREWTEKAPSASSYRALAMLHLLSGRAADAVEAARRALDLDGTGFSRSYLAEALMAAERYAEAEALLRPAAEPTASRLDRITAVPALAVVLGYQGRRREALQIAEGYAKDFEDKAGKHHALRLQLLMGDRSPEAALREARAVLQAGDPEERKFLPLILLCLGDEAGAIEMAKGLPPGNERTQFEAALSWRRGEPEKALPRLRQLAKESEHDSRGITLWLLSKVALESHREEAAAAAAEGLAKVWAGAWRSWGYPQALYLAAVARERLGERAKARQMLDHLLDIWKRADPDLPLLAEARAMRKRLASAR
jgi:eukaryotic-like serine/threonine-protein kinase